MNNERIETLIEEAFAARKMAYTPYSHFQVGAALLTEKGGIYRGCNIENAAFTPTNCAERTAFFKGISEGVRAFRAIAIAGGRQGALSDYVMPCGVCRQVMAEFCKADFEILLAKDTENWKSYTLEQLLPERFTL